MNTKKTNKRNSTDELTQTELDKLMQDLQKFEESFYIALTNTDRYEIVPTLNQSGKSLSKEQLSLINQECLRLGVKIIYRVELDKTVLLANPENLKIGYLTEGTVH